MDHNIGRFIILLSLFVIFLPQASASQNILDSRLSWANLSDFDRGLYFTAIDIIPCIDMDEFYAHADSDPYDDRQRSDILDYRYKLGRSDYQRLIDQNPFDNIDHNSYDIRDNPLCSEQSEWVQEIDADPFDSLTSEEFYIYHGWDDYLSYQNQKRHDPEEVDYYFMPPRQNYVSQLQNVNMARITYDGAMASWSPFS